ncbi:DJ-1/PfpI family protein [Thiovibrio frasassiensis]|uniref:DJ-1/PfpI family protein n=1 Tax=Thiovibrio frasassiensis TaxID=2984131 RepID=A0A9X4MGB4_9BACT|nr:DJ-1/PfpI family protein [Thiovibrio frasassiensis]MDG4476984.1 DJ-1/PfpI family protein [Thiovibrio frasassiensis]
MATVLMIIAPERFRDEELFLTQAELEKEGHKTVIASLVKGVCPGSLGRAATATLTLAEVKGAAYKAVVFVGGPGSKLYFSNPEALRIAKEFSGQGKVVAAICVAPVILANAGLLAGKQATVFSSEIKGIEGKGAHYTGAEVTVDGNLVTADGPKSARLFGQKIAELLQRSGTPEK